MEFWKKRLLRGEKWNVIKKLTLVIALVLTNPVIKKGIVVTDESSAMEQAGYNPKLVEGHADNIKITTPGDLTIAECFLKGLEGT